MPRTQKDRRWAVGKMRKCVKDKDEKMEGEGIECGKSGGCEGGQGGKRK